MRQQPRELGNRSDEQMLRILEQITNEQTLQPQLQRRVTRQLLWWSLRIQLSRRTKRAYDLTIVLLGLLTLWPIMAITAILICLESPGSPIFRQTRIGKWGKPFICYKFRSMYTDAEARKAELMELNEASGPIFKMQNDPRMTRVGRVIRKLSIDELPQLFNILKGDMSLVGPRPPVPYEVENYELYHLRRLNATPGLTGLQQISGRSDLPFERWVELDLQYISERSLRNDLLIMLKTIPTVLFGRGAY